MNKVTRYAVTVCLAAVVFSPLHAPWAYAHEDDAEGEESHVTQDAPRGWHEDARITAREAAARRISWEDRGRDRRDDRDPVRVKILGINDFHGQLSAGKTVGGRPVGSAPVLAAYLKTAQQGWEDRAIIVHAGDHVGASPASSALLQDEPSISFLNLLGNRACTTARRTNPHCNLVGTLGNHEFDEGREEMMRLIFGGNHPSGPFLEDPYRGTTFPYISANVVEADTGRPILPPYVIKRVGGMPVAFIGAVLKGTPNIVTPAGVAGLRFLDEAEAINAYVPELKARHVRTIVVLIHQGGRQTFYTGETAPDGQVTGEIKDIVARLDDEIDVVVSGHTHSFTNALLKNANGKEILVTQAFAAGTAYSDIQLDIDRRTRDVVAKSASIVTTYADVGPGLAPDPTVAELVRQAEEKVAPLVNEVIGVAADNITRTQNSAGESALGNLIADAQRAAMNTDFAFMNPGGIRADLAAGQVTWGQLFSVQPFGNSLVKMGLTGQQIYDLLNQQWQGTGVRMLQVSGLSYIWDAARPVGERVVEVRRNNQPIDRAAVYSVTVNSFIAGGGDGFSVLTQGANQVVGPVDLDALVAYLRGLPQPFSAIVENRIQRQN